MFRQPLVQQQIQIQNIHPRFAEKPEIALFRGGSDQFFHFIVIRPASLRHSGGLGHRILHTDLRIKAAGSRCYRVGRNRTGEFGILLAKLVH